MLLATASPDAISQAVTAASSFPAAVTNIAVVVIQLGVLWAGFRLAKRVLDQAGDGYVPGDGDHYGWSDGTDGDLVNGGFHNAVVNALDDFESGRHMASDEDEQDDRLWGSDDKPVLTQNEAWENAVTHHTLGDTDEDEEFT